MQSIKLILGGFSCIPLIRIGFIGRRYVRFDSFSATTNVQFIPSFVWGRSSSKSIEMTSQFSRGGGKGLNLPYKFWLILSDLSHTTQFFYVTVHFFVNLRPEYISFNERYCPLGSPMGTKEWSMIIEDYLFFYIALRSKQALLKLESSLVPMKWFSGISFMLFKELIFFYYWSNICSTISFIITVATLNSFRIISPHTLYFSLSLRDKASATGFAFPSMYLMS